MKRGMMIFSDEHIKALKNFDFYKKGKLDEMNVGLKTVKAWGNYQVKPPFLSVIVTTYKRPHYLKVALDSIIRQRFYDYEIIVVDNECADINIDTDTQKLIKSLCNPKIVYFRNINPMKGRMDRGASLASGDWICFCHDDDLLAANHFEIMVRTIKEHPEINFLCCEHRVFYDKDFNKIENNGFISNNRHDGCCREASKQEGVFFQQGSWAGALIKRQLYAEMGGMPNIETGCSDLIFCSKFNYWYSGFFRLNAPMYFYRLSNNQVSSLIDNWMNTYISQFFFSKYAILKLSDNLDKIDLDQLCLSYILKSMKLTEQLWGITFDLNQYFLKCDIENTKYDFNKSCKYVEFWENILKQQRKRHENNDIKIYINKVAAIPYD